MKVARRLSDVKISYRSEPDFGIGEGIQNSILIFEGIATDYEEVEITQQQWDDAVLQGDILSE